MRLHKLTSPTANALSGIGPIPYRRAARCTVAPDELTVRLSPAETAAAISTLPPPPQQLADGGSVALTAAPSRWLRLRLWALCVALVAVGLGLGCLAGWVIAALATAIGKALA